MNRRSFLQLPLALALASGADAEPTEARRQPFKVAAGADRFAEELLLMGGRFDLKVSARDTGGDLCIYDTFRDTRGGPALHLHHHQDEWFYVMRGAFLVRVGETTLRLGPGDSAFGPRRIPHTFAMTGEGEGHMLIVFQPAGSMEVFFRQMSALGPGIPNDPARLKRLFEEHGMELVGPPLAV